jgi:hypothetical protein
MIALVQPSARLAGERRFDRRRQLAALPLGAAPSRSADLGMTSAQKVSIAAASGGRWRAANRAPACPKTFRRAAD